MGNGTFNASASAARASMRTTTGTSAFAHSAAAKAGKVAALHETLDLTKKPQRECRDNPDNPLSVPIAVMVDVTGSMGEIAKYIIDDLHKVVSVIRDRGVVKNPSLCFGATGDAFSDRVPIQMGEFEADDELAEKHLSNIYIEGNGGGNNGESYDLGLWFFANQVTTDHWEKRGQKGFLFMIGDEELRLSAPAAHIKEHCGVDAGEDQDIAAVITKLHERWEVFVLRPGGTCHFSDLDVRGTWTKHFPAERVIDVADWKEIVSLIAGTISIISGLTVDDVLATMKDSGLAAGSTTSTALATVASSAAIVAAGGAELTTAEETAGAGATRL